MTNIHSGIYYGVIEAFLSENSNEYVTFETQKVENVREVHKEISKITDKLNISKFNYEIRFMIDIMVEAGNDEDFQS